MNLFEYVLHCSVKRMALLIILTAASAFAAHAQVIWSSPVNVSQAVSGFAVDSQVAVDPGGRIYIAWRWHVTPQSDYQVLFSRSSDGGTTFSTPVNLSNSSASSTTPRIALDANGNISIIWGEVMPGVGKNVFFSRSNDAGVSFSLPQNLSAGGNVDTSNLYQMAVDASGNVNVVWSINTGQILLTRSTDGGATFSTPLDVTGGRGGIVPSIALDAGGNINIAWEGIIAVSSCGPTPYLNAALFFTRSVDGGTTFSNPQDISLSSLDGVFGYRIAVDLSGQIDFAWESNSLDSTGCPIWTRNVLFSESTDGGATFSAVQNLWKSSGAGTVVGSIYLQMAVDTAGNVNVAWPDTTTPTTIYARSSDKGVSFSVPRQIATGISLQMATDFNGNIVLLDWDLNSASGGYLSRSSDGGAVFFPTPLPGDMSSGLFSSPQAAAMALDSVGNVNLTWWSTGSTNQSLLFSHGTVISVVSLSAAGLSAASHARGPDGVPAL